MFDRKTKPASMGVPLYRSVRKDHPISTELYTSLKSAEKKFFHMSFFANAKRSGLRFRNAGMVSDPGDRNEGMKGIANIGSWTMEDSRCMIAPAQRLNLSTSRAELTDNATESRV